MCFCTFFIQNGFNTDWEFIIYAVCEWHTAENPASKQPEQNILSQTILSHDTIITAQRKKTQRHPQCSRTFYIKGKTLKLQLRKRATERTSDTQKSSKDCLIFLCSSSLAIHTTPRYECEHEFSVTVLSIFRLK